MELFWRIWILHIIIASAQSQRDTIFSPDERNVRPGRVTYYRSTLDDNSYQKIPWEEPLKQAAFISLHGQRGIQEAEYVGNGGSRFSSAHRFGDIALLARGRLIRTREGGFRFIEDDKSDDCEGCHIPDLEIRMQREFARRSLHEHQLAAIWRVRRVRHRDPVRGHRYELQFTITPMDEDPRSSRYPSGERSFIIRDEDYPQYFRLAEPRIQNNDLTKQGKETLTFFPEDNRYTYAKMPAKRNNIPSLNTNEYYADRKLPQQDLNTKETYIHERFKEPTGRHVRFPAESATKVPDKYKHYRDEQEIQQTRVYYGTTSDLDSNDQEDIRPYRKRKFPSQHHITHLHHHHYYIAKPDFQTLPIDAKLLQDEYLANRGKYVQPNNVYPASTMRFPTGPQVQPTVSEAPIQYKQVQSPFKEILHYQQQDVQKSAQNFKPSPSLDKYSEPDPLYHGINTPPSSITTQILVPTETSIAQPINEGYFATTTPEHTHNINCTTHNINYIVPTQLLPTNEYEETRTEPMSVDRRVSSNKLLAQSSNKRYDTKSLDSEARPTNTLPETTYSTLATTAESTTVLNRGTVTRVKPTTTKPTTTVRSKWTPRRRQKPRTRTGVRTTTSNSIDFIDKPTALPSKSTEEIYNIITYSTTTESLDSSKPSTAVTESYKALDIKSGTPNIIDETTTASTDIEPLTRQSNSTSISYRIGKSLKNKLEDASARSPKIYEVFRNAEITTIKTPIATTPIKRFRKQRTKYRATTDKPAEHVTFDDLTLSILNHARKETILNNT